MRYNIMAWKITKEKLNVFIAILVSAYILSPFLQVRVKALFLVACLLLWIVTTDFYWIKRKFTLDIFFLGVFFISFLPYILTSTLRFGSAHESIIYISFPIFFIGFLFGHYYIYYLENPRINKTLLYWILIIYLIGLIQTYFGLNEFPNASRELAGAVNRNPELVYVYGLKGIGGYGFIYGAVFITISLFKLFISKYQFNIFTKVLFLLFIITSTLTIFRALYAIAIFMLILGSITIILIRRKFKAFFLLSFIGILLIVISSTFLGEFMLLFSNLFKNNQFIYNKFIDLSYSLIGNSNYSIQTTNRLDLYTNSLNSFINYPIFGIYGPLGNSNSLIGQHSSWLDLSAMYGLFTFVPLVLMFYFFVRKSFQRSTINPIGKSILVVIFLYFAILGLINPVLNVAEIGFVIFFVIPLISIQTRQ